MNDSQFDIVQSWLSTEQAEFVGRVACMDKDAQREDDQWTQSLKSRGRTVVFDDGKVFEKIAINFSTIAGNALPQAATVKRPDLAGAGFRAVGLSIVSHPLNPFVPTAHENLRFFMTTSSDKPRWWFGGGFDLTPYYGFVEDAVRWHKAANKLCSPYGETVYREFKKQCDEYFEIPHRSEYRGIGGLFFDDLDYWPFDKCFEFIKDVGHAFSQTYFDIVRQRQQHDYDANERLFQQYRRGRYAEFNLVRDRGTLFGLQFGGRIKSILASLPPTVSWPYSISEKQQDEENKLVKHFLIPRDWLGER